MDLSEQQDEPSINPWLGTRVAITGVCGTVGSELLRQLVELGPAEIVGIDNNETELFFLSQAFRDRPEVRLSLGDVRDRQGLIHKLEGLDVVIHTAAYKHVILCEESPGDAVQTNILGTQNVIDAVLANGVGRMIFTSSDKAVNPTSVMGTAKLMGERLMTAADSLTRGNEPIFASTRFGNVLGSRGSVIPIFRRQILAGDAVTITNAEMTRFIMTLRQAVRLVLDSVFLARGGEVFVTKMPTLSIVDLARVMIEDLAPVAGHSPDQIETRFIGEKAGEKLYEELINSEEVRRTLELERYFVVLPALKAVHGMKDYEYPGQLDGTVAEPYNSATSELMTVDEVRGFLHDGGLLSAESGP